MRSSTLGANLARSVQLSWTPLGIESIADGAPYPNPNPNPCMIDFQMQFTYWLWGPLAMAGRHDKNSRTTQRTHVLGKTSNLHPHNLLAQ
jgi:hypothetical protein